MRFVIWYIIVFCSGAIWGSPYACRLKEWFARLVRVSTNCLECIQVQNWQSNVDILRGTKVNAWQGPVFRGVRNQSILDSGSHIQRHAYEAMSSLERCKRYIRQNKKIPTPSFRSGAGIFLQYYNLYPVMWKYDIIDLHSYDDIKKRSRMLYDSMFTTEFASAR